MIVIAAWLSTWVGLVVFVAATVGVAALLRGGTKPTPPARHPERAAVEDTRRILVVADETLGGARLREEIVRMADGVAEDVLVVCSTPDEDSARAAAGTRLAAALADLMAAGVNVRGEIGDGDPLRALEDALRGFAADAIVISTHGVERSDGPEPGVVDAARARFGVPVAHISGDASP